jgi:superfamily II DNA or RNA helicase
MSLYRSGCSGALIGNTSTSCFALVSIFRCDPRHLWTPTSSAHCSGTGVAHPSEVSITTVDPEIESYIRETAAAYGLRVPRREITYYLSGTRGPGGNRIGGILGELGLRGLACEERFIPDLYRVGSREVRSKLLAGLLDTDGSLRPGGYELVSKSATLADQAAFVAHSLGLAAYVRPKQVRSPWSGKTSTYYRVAIWGDCDTIPCRIARKRCEPRKQIKDVRRTGFTVEPTETVEPYFGFTLNGEGRYLLGDFTVTHNTGKTAVFASLIAKRGGSALVLAHRDELLRQAAEKIAIADPTLALGVGFVAAQRDDVHAPVVVGSVQTLARASRLAKLPRRFDTVVVDEGHHVAARSYRRILEHLSPTPLILGVTATPARADGKRLGDVWQEIVYQRGIAEMIRAGYLADIRGVRVGLEQVKLDEVEQSGGDFDADALGKVLERASAPLHVLTAYRQHATGRKAIVFVPTVALAHRMATVFREGGIRAEALDGTTPWEQRRAILARLHTGETRVVANVAVLGEGVDVPSVDAVILATPTRSQVKYTQCLGRGLRTFPGKEDCLVIDLVGASERLDLQTLPRLFNLRDVPAPEVTVTEALERARLEKAEIDRRRAVEQKADERAAAAGRETPDGELRSRAVSMLAARRRTARRLRWLRHRECWLVSLGSTGTLALVPDGSRWRVLNLQGAKHDQLASGVDLGYAHGIAEDYVRPPARRRSPRRTHGGARTR